MLRNNLQNLEILYSDLYIAHLAAHAEALKHTCWVRAGADRTWLTQTVVLTVSRLAYATETMTLDDALETMALRGADDVNEINVREEVDGDDVTELILLLITLEFGEVLHRSYTCLLEVTHYWLRDMLLSSLLEADLYSFITILLDRLDLSHNTRTYFNNSAWHVLAISTEDGSHSDFFAQ